MELEGMAVILINNSYHQYRTNMLPLGGFVRKEFYSDIQ